MICATYPHALIIKTKSYHIIVMYDKYHLIMNFETYQKSKNAIDDYSDPKPFYDYVEENLEDPVFREVVSSDIDNDDFNTVYNVMQYAVGYDKVDMVRNLLDCGADVNAQPTDMSAMIFYAIEFGHIDCLRLFIERGADLAMKNHLGMTPYQYSQWCSEHTDTFYPHYNSDAHRCLY